MIAGLPEVIGAGVACAAGIAYLVWRMWKAEQ